MVVGVAVSDASLRVACLRLMFRIFLALVECSRCVLVLFSRWAVYVRGVRKKKRFDARLYR